MDNKEKDTFEESMKKIDDSIKKIVSLNNYLKSIDKKIDFFS